VQAGNSEIMDWEEFTNTRFNHLKTRVIDSQIDLKTIDLTSSFMKEK